MKVEFINVQLPLKFNYTVQIQTARLKIMKKMLLLIVMVKYLVNLYVRILTENESSFSSVKIGAYLSMQFFEKTSAKPSI